MKKIKINSKLDQIRLKIDLTENAIMETTDEIANFLINQLKRLEKEAKELESIIKKVNKNNKLKKKVSKK